MFMKYSLFISLVRMSETLLSARKYLCNCSEMDLKEEIVANGKIMIAQIKSVLLQHRGALRSLHAVELLVEIEEGWESFSGERNIEESLYKLICLLPKEIHYRMRAVFFAELGEKWDSMNSVYQFMKDDERFDPVVVLTPVFRIVKMKEGGIKHEIIYKDYLTGMNIPYIPYDEYNIQQDNPDLAFICQPYESATLQKFWPETISKFTRLVYLPYYVPHVIEQTTKKALCEIPVYDYAWRVIGLNQKHFEYYSRYSYSNGANMLVTGIPKTDALVHLAERGIPFPVTWGKIKGKTCFLWNTWYKIDASSFQFVDGLLEWFNDHKDCALIWRPHPMMDAVTKLYHPEHYQRLQNIKDKIMQLENGIVDCEVSCEASFFYSAAQISDYSSLLVQYIFMDKPLLWIKNDEWKIEEEEFVGSQWIESATNMSEVVCFLERVRCGEDRNLEWRNVIRQRDLSLADGCCGERVCNALWDEVHEEDGI